MDAGERHIRIRIPAAFDSLLQNHAGERDVDDDLCRVYIVSLLASVIDGLDAPGVADALVRLNGGYMFRSM